MIDTIGVRLDDLSDSNIVWESYESDIPPAEAAAELFGNDDLAAMIFDEDEISDMFGLG